MASPPSGNWLLSALSRSDRALLTSGLEPIDMPLRHVVEEANTPITNVYFPNSGVVSVVARSTSGRIEAGLVGREGMTGAAIVLGDTRSPNDAFVQIAGDAHRISAKRLRAAMAGSASLRQLMQRYVHVFMIQVAQTAFANGSATIETRLARWLLMAHDRQDDADLALTHEFISVMLGVRRPGVTDALHALESKGAIRSNRGTVRIVNRKALLAIAGSTYGVPEAEYKRVFG